MKKTIFIFKIIGNIIIVILLIIGLTFAISMLPIKNNFKIYAVMSGSMEPTLKTGSVVFSMPAKNYYQGDIITFYSISNKKETTTHRIINIIDENGSKIFQTKGDSNNATDIDKVMLANVIGKEFFTIPYIGYVLRYIKTLPGLLILIIIPSTIIIYEESKKIHQEAKQMLKNKKNKRVNKRKGRQ